MRPLHILFRSVIFITAFSFSCLAQDIDLTEACTQETFKQYDNFINKNAPDEDAFVAVQRVAAMYIQKKQWKEASDIFKKYSPLFKKMNERFEKIIALLDANEEGLIVTNLGPEINTDAGEYMPVPTADGLLLYFCGKERPAGLGGEDIFVSELQNGKWQKAVNLGSDINTDSHEAPMAISADGNRIILFGNYKESLGYGDNFYADKTVGGWSKIEHFPEPINSEYFDNNAMLTSDGKAILFTSDRPNGVGDYHKKGILFDGSHFGNVDIYISIKTETGWSEPINLGSTINTPYCEYTPFLHPDGRSLYFSSDGHYGLGDLDVFKSIRLNDTSWNEWSEPVNLGKEINTIGYDWGYKVTTSGDVAYFSAYDKSDGYGENDIYSITLPKEVRPELVATVRGKVTDNKSNPIEAGIKWENLTTGENVGELKSNPQDGNYFIVLPLGKNYGYYAEKKGYYPVSHNINLQDTTGAVNITENIVLVSIEEMREKEIAVRINNIFFDYDKYDIKSESFPELDRLANILKENQDTKIEIAGHTDNKGSDTYNSELSKKRAQAVVSYLCSTGCNVKNLVAKGYGESNPVASNETEEGCTQNRRVEFKFIK